MDEENKVLNFLKKYNIEVGTHVLYDSAASKFFRFLAENITAENVLQNDELRDYYEMEQTASTCEQQEILYGEDLKKSLGELKNKFPNLTKYDDEEVKMCENDFKDITELKELYETILNESKMLLNETKKNNLHLNKKLIYVQEHDERLNSECLQNLKEAQEIHNNIQKSRQEIESICSCIQLSPFYIHQFPLEDFFSKCRDFNNYTDQYLRKSFEVTDLNMPDVEADDDKYTVEIGKIKQIINNSTFKLKKAEMKLSSLKSVIKELENFNRISYGYQDMKHELEQATQENKEKNLQINILTETLKKSVHKLNQQKINSLIHDANAFKIQRAERRLKDVQQIENMSQKFMLLCEVLWFSVNFDTDMLNAYKNVLREDIAEERNHLNCLKGIEKLNTLLLDDLVANYSTEFINEITKRLTRSNFNQITLKHYDEMITNIPVQLETISNKSGYGDINQYIQFLQENSCEIVKLVYDGPLAKPQVVNPDLRNIIYNYKIEKAKINKKLNELRETFKQEFKIKWVNSKTWKYSNLLWIWFLTDPKRITDAIDEIKLMESKTRKVVSGMLCKRI